MSEWVDGPRHRGSRHRRKFTRLRRFGQWLGLIV